MRKVRHEELTSQEWNRFFLRNAIGFSEEYASQECAKLTSQEYVCSQECKISFLRMRFLSSQEYASQEYEIVFQEYGTYFLKIPVSSQEFDRSVAIVYLCSCPQFGKKAICKHSLLFSIKAKKVLVPANVDITKVGRAKKKRGRPAQNGDALRRLERA